MGGTGSEVMRLERSAFVSCTIKFPHFIRDDEYTSVYVIVMYAAKIGDARRICKDSVRKCTLYDILYINTIRLIRSLLRVINFYGDQLLYSRPHFPCRR